MTLQEIQNKIETTDAVLLYFSGENCAVCKALMPKIQSAFKTTFPKIEQYFISASNYPQIAAKYSIFTVPSILIFFNGKETKRESRHISVTQLLQSTKRPYDMFFN